jgi:hypothetical protein
VSSWPSSRTRGRSSCGHDAPLIPWPRLARSGRLALAELAAGRTSEILVRDVSSRFHRWNQFDRKQAPGFAKLRAQTNVSIAAPPVPATAACAHQYSINVPGFGYSSRLRALLRCGGAVVHVVHASSEFFMPLLRHREHLYLLDGREPVRGLAARSGRDLVTSVALTVGAAWGGTVGRGRWGARLESDVLRSRS